MNQPHPHGDCPCHAQRAGGEDAGAGPANAPGGNGRRGFLFAFGSGLMALGGVIAALPMVGAVLAPGRKRAEDSWIDLGDLSSFPVGETRLATFVSPVVAPNDGDSAKVACWVRRIDESKLQVFAVNCAHLGCPVRWFQQSRLFMCPCHGGVYYEDGSRASGPPPRGLFEYPWKVVGGRLLIEGSRLPGLQEGVAK